MVTTERKIVFSDEDAARLILSTRSASRSARRQAIAQLEVVYATMKVQDGLKYGASLTRLVHR